MQKMKSLLALLSLCFFLSCEEIPPVITPVKPGTDPNSVPRRILVEEFTGVRCVNCPAGTAEVLNLKGIYKEQLIPVGIHAGSFAPPYPDSKLDFRTPEGDGIINLLGRPLGYPSAVINRKKFENEFDLQLNRGQWAGFVAAELAQAPVVEVRVVNNYNVLSRQLSVQVEVEPLRSLPAGDLRLSVMLAEDKVVDVQLTPDGKQSDYSHRHNLRDMLTPFDGEPLSNALVGGKKWNKTYNFTLPAAWVDSNCSIIAFVHLGGSTLDVLQAAEGKVR